MCDAPRVAGALAFLSHAGVVGPRVGARSPITAAQVLLTQTCANLLEAAGHNVDPRALVAAYGRPFVLGLLRVELFPSGVAPGSASLLCESPKGHVVFAGPIGLGKPGSQTLPAEIRPAAAICLDATFAGLETAFAPVHEAIADTVNFVKTATASGKQPVVLASVDSLSLDLARAFVSEGFVVRAHTSFIKLAEIHTAAGLLPTPLLRFSGRIGPKELLMVPTSVKVSATLEKLKTPCLVITAGVPIAPSDLDRLRPEGIFPLTNAATRKDLLAYIKATGTKEVATLNDAKGAFAAVLRDTGLDAYHLGPPAQMTLFAA